MDILTIKSENVAADKEAIEAQKRWVNDGTVTDKYLKRVLGDISKGVSIVAPEAQEEKNSNKRNPRTS